MQSCRHGEMRNDQVLFTFTRLVLRLHHPGRPRVLHRKQLAKQPSLTAFKPLCSQRL